MRPARLLFGLCLGALLCLPAAAAPRPDGGRPLISIVIDDLGQNLARDRQVLELSPAIALAIIPDTPHAAELARPAREAEGTGDDALAKVVPSGHGTDADAGDYLTEE